MLDVINSIHFINKKTGKDIGTGRIKCVDGWTITIRGIKQLWQQISIQHQQKFLCTRRLNQDCLEKFLWINKKQKW